mgnify:FL=1
MSGGSEDFLKAFGGGLVGLIVCDPLFEFVGGEGVEVEFELGDELSSEKMLFEHDEVLNRLGSVLEFQNRSHVFGGEDVLREPEVAVSQRLDFFGELCVEIRIVDRGEVRNLFVLVGEVHFSLVSVDERESEELNGGGVFMKLA